MRKLLLLAPAIFFAAAAFAQDAPKVQVAVDYSYLHTPQGSFVPGSSFNGGGISLAYFFFKHVGLKAEFTDYGSYGQVVTVPANTQGCNSQSNCALSVHGNLFTYTVGPVLRFHFKRVQPLADCLTTIPSTWSSAAASTFPSANTLPSAPSKLITFALVLGIPP
jgi:hypothetical protein